MPSATAYVSRIAGGAANAPGVQTTNAATAPARVFAVVNSDGSKVRGKAVASTAHLSGPGFYDVRFLRDITKCAWTGTVGIGSTPFGGNTLASMISVSGRAGTNNGLFVQTFNSSGAATDLPFQVVVCG